MPNRDVVVTVTMRDAASKAAAGLKRAFDDFARSAGIVSRQTGDSMARLSQGFKQSSETIERSAGSIRRVTVSQREMSAALSTATRRFREARAQTAEFAAQTEAAVAAFRRNRLEMVRQARAARLSQRALRAVDRTIRFVTRDVRAATRSWARFALVMAAPVGRGMVRGFRQAGREAAAMRRAIFGLRSTILLLGGGAVLGASAKMAASFEQSLSRIVGLVGVSQRQVNAWREELLRLGPEVSKGPRELAEAMFFVTSAGLRGQKAMEVLAASAKAATAGLGETKVVADAVTSAINAYGVENLSAERAAGILVATVREGKAAADSIASSLGRVLPIAAAAGVGFDQVGAAIAAMTRVGLPAEVATTSLRAVLGSFIKVGPAAAKALEKVGLSAGEIRKTLREGGLIDVLIQLRDAIKGNEDQFVEIIPNIRAVTGALALVGSQMEQTRKIEKALREETGQSLGVAFAVAADTATAKWNQMTSAMEGALIGLGDFITEVGRAGALAALTALAKDLGAAFRGLRTDQEGARATADAFVSVLEAIAMTAAGVSTVIDRLRQGFIAIKAVWIAARSVLGMEGMMRDLLGLKEATAADALEVMNLLTAFDNLNKKHETGADLASKVERSFERMRQAMRGVRAEQEAAARQPPVIQGPVLIGGLIEDLRAQTLESEKAAKADQERVQSSNALLVPLLKQIEATKEFRTALAAAVAEARQAVLSEKELGKATAALPPDFAAFVMGATNATEATERLAIAQEKARLQSEGMKVAQAQLRDEIAKAPTAMEALIDDGFTPLQAAVSSFNETVEDEARRVSLAAALHYKRFLDQSKLDAVAAARFVTGTIQAFSAATADFVGRVLDEAFEGQIKTMQDVGRIAQDVLKNLLRSILQEMVRVTTQALITKAIVGVAGAKGGIFPGPFIPVESFAGGGVATRPTFGLVAEAGRAEAMVPLPDNRNIPVKFVGDERPGGGNIANVIFNVQSLDPRGVAEVLLSSSGRESIRMAVADGMRRQPRFKKAVGGRS